MTDSTSNQAVSLQEVSESLRGPLASLGVCLQTLRDHAGDEAAPFVNSALGDVERLSRLARNLLQWSELQAGTLHPHATSFCVSSRVMSVLEWHMKQAREGGIPFRVVMEPGDDRAWTDPELAAGILDALLEHVFSASEDGGVEVAVRMGEAACSVTITADHASGRTETFHLARARAVADLIGGHIRMQPSVAAGTLFEAHWPLRLPRETSLYLAA